MTILGSSALSDTPNISRDNNVEHIKAKELPELFVESKKGSWGMGE
ncbi:MAG: hypothetical protein K6T72_10575 [Anoxybacillus sp.]|nr:hypothetical protein [Anoxybacillus sp.]MCL6586936.1 hypothetical protein [Anoxybacillus sp.]